MTDLKGNYTAACRTVKRIIQLFLKKIKLNDEQDEDDGEDDHNDIQTYSKIFLTGLKLKL